MRTSSAMIAALAALLLLAQPAQGRSYRVDIGEPLTGADYLLIAEAARHPEMRGANLACYRIYVFDGIKGRREVAFVAARNRETVTHTATETIITIEPPDPKCRSISFVADLDGRITRVIYSRH